jgi:hypothetical protein
MTSHFYKPGDVDPHVPSLPMITPAERDAIRAGAFREAAEIARDVRADEIVSLNSARKDGSKTGPYASGSVVALRIAQAIEARAKEKQP